MELKSYVTGSTILHELNQEFGCIAINDLSFVM